MGIMISPETLRSHALFAGLDHCMIKALAMAGEKVIIKQGEWLFYEGNEADALYVVISGAVALKVALDHERSSHVELCTLVAGDLLGWSAVVEPGVYHLSASAIKDSTLVKWGGADLAELMTHQPAMGFKLMCRIVQVVGERLAEFAVRFASLVEGDQWQGVSAWRSPNVPDRN
jgi:CRP/FNR family transcriptional regulator, cyclic AMP receptor protein